MKQNKKTKKGIEQKNDNIYFEVILMIIIIPFFSFLTLSIFMVDSLSPVDKISTSKEDIKIITDDKFYLYGEDIKLSIKNNSMSSIYFEPCEYLNKFEKKIDGKWIKSSSYKGEKIYDKFKFNKEKNITNCEIEMPREGLGIYRVVVQIYYKCEKPGEDMCGSSKTFYSNEFEVL